MRSILFAFFLAVSLSQFSLSLIQISIMKFVVYFYLILQLAASYFINLHITTEKFTTHLVLLTLGSLTFIITSIIDPGYYHTSRLEQAQAQPQQAVAFSLTKKCNDCQIEQLLRMKHCQDCRKCVATYDHHCIWIDNCVGEKNRPIFILCLVINALEMGFAMFELIAAMWQRGEKFTSQIVFLSFLGILLGGIVLLSVMHLYLMSVNLTTRQILRWDRIGYLGARPKKQGSPFSRGLVRNIGDYWVAGCSYKFKVWRLQQKLALKTSQEQTQSESRQEISNTSIMK